MLVIYVTVDSVTLGNASNKAPKGLELTKTTKYLQQQSNS